MGNLNCDYTQVTAFYNYWSGFSSCMEFWWADEHDVELGYDRKSRRLYEEQNKKSRKKAKKEYNETVRGLAEFVKKRDKRVVEMKMKKALEEEKKKEELKEKKKELERQKLERARLYEEPDWAKVEEEDIGFEEVDDSDKKRDEIKELYCVICNKKFKSDKQWKNHEQSKKHKEKVAMFKEEMGSDDQSEEEVEEILNEVNEEKAPSVSGNDAVVDDLSEKFEDAFEFQEEEAEEVKKSSIEEEEDEVEDEEEEDEIDVSDVNHDNEADNSGSDEESILLKAMLSRQKNKKKTASKRETEMPPPSSETPDTTTTTDDGVSDFMVYDNVKKSARGNRRAKKDNGKKSNGVSQRSEMNEVTEEGNELDNSNAMGSSSDTIDEVGQKSRADPPPSGKNVKGHKKAVDKRGSGTEDMVSNSKKASKGRKQKNPSQTPCFPFHSFELKS
ncbi:hypothetical protein MKW94_003666 [Papaver nudicaule]|uniref:C2H2-type domain-containing protein n=1 Tax=Papaver nudicaule TaxID=74823 RepID=A0AA41RRQ8_PAPNU|nr:hypothetical protein [Papaver nudicaule]